MIDRQANWLPHLKNAVPITGFGKKLSMYTIALEGWRRGLKLKFFRIDDPENKLRIRYTLASEDREHYFESSKGDKTTDLAHEICNDKHLTKEYLRKAGVPIAEGKKFSADADDEEIVEYAESLGFPLVIKPVSANGGKGVVSNISNKERFKSALNYVRNELDYKEVIVEKFVSGDEYRFVVVDGKVVGVLNRVPAHIVGDGVHTIRQLIRQKNNERKQNPHLKSRMIKIDKQVKKLLESNGYTLKSVPLDGEIIPLRLTSNLSTGGDSVELTDEVSPELKQIAIDGTKAIPGLTVSGMDIIVDHEKNTGVVIEANTRPGLGGHLFPVEGTPRDIPKQIVDFYFPETKDCERSNLYFDFNSILEPLTNRTAKVVEVTPIKPGKMYAKKYIISGKVQKTGYKVWIKRQALLRNMHGFAKDLENGDVVVVVSSLDENEVNNFINVCKEGNGKQKITNISEEPWELPLQVGFHISEHFTTEEYRELEKEKDEIEKERDYYKKEYIKIKNSRMWRYTSPVRTVLDILKGKRRRRLS